MRWWNESAGRIDERIPLPLVMLALLLIASLIGLLLYFWPRWLPHHWWLRFWRALLRGVWAIGRFFRRLALAVVRWRPRLPKPGWWRLRFAWRWRRRGRPVTVPGTEVAPEPADDVLPDLPEQDFLSLADWYAGQGRYAEAVRERLRAILRALVDAGVITNPPGSTVLELSAGASAALPAVRPAVTGAGEVFSELWYGMRPATAGHDAQMRDYAAATAAVLTGTPVPAGGAR